ncbi:hypothetical protein BOS5A_180013 [Bosea sp. EC-HK365B]|nr:hypothetical protein BOSE7B_60663 [Bosea sp. 7B]VVT57019.1 hypothetical protein BOS5A_180013 [Bosea sp. EC-HK365B]VXB46982.1 hypothetical protein BOSE127_120124 [Bosea sp. 127]
MHIIWHGGTAVHNAGRQQNRAGAQDQVPGYRHEQIAVSRQRGHFGGYMTGAISRGLSLHARQKLQSPYAVRETGMVVADADPTRTAFSAVHDQNRQMKPGQINRSCLTGRAAADHKAVERTRPVANERLAVSFRSKRHCEFRSKPILSRPCRCHTFELPQLRPDRSLSENQNRKTNSTSVGAGLYT